METLGTVERRNTGAMRTVAGAGVSRTTLDGGTNLSQAVSPTVADLCEIMIPATIDQQVQGLSIRLSKRRNSASQADGHAAAGTGCVVHNAKFLVLGVAYLLGASFVSVRCTV